MACRQCHVTALRSPILLGMWFCCADVCVYRIEDNAESSTKTTASNSDYFPVGGEQLVLRMSNPYSGYNRDGQGSTLSPDYNSGYGSHDNNLSAYNKSTDSSYSAPINLSGSSGPGQGYPSSSYGSPGQAPADYSGSDGRNPLSDAGFGHPVGGGGRLDPNYKFSPAEQAILRECNNESFYYRSVPLMATIGTTTYLMVKQGMLKASPKYGAIPKVIAGAVLGYFAGKVSYYKQCEEKFLRLPDSRVAEAIRRRRSGDNTPLPPAPSAQYPSWNPQANQPGRQFGSYQSGMRSGPYEAPSPAQSSSEPSSGMNTDDYISSLDIDSEKNKYFAGDDTKPSSHDLDVDRAPGGNWDTDAEKGRKPSADYDDMRRQHRDAYFKTPASPRG